MKIILIKREKIMEIILNNILSIILNIIRKKLECQEGFLIARKQLPDWYLFFRNTTLTTCTKMKIVVKKSLKIIIRYDTIQYINKQSKNHLRRIGNV